MTSLWRRRPTASIRAIPAADIPARGEFRHESRPFLSLAVGEYYKWLPVCLRYLTLSQKISDDFVGRRRLGIEKVMAFAR